MTPKDKAEELVQKHKHVHKETCVEAALITARECQGISIFDRAFDWWQEVVEELEKMKA